MNNSSQNNLNKSWVELFAKVAHDLVGQLAVLRLKNRQLQKIAPSIVKGYHLAVSKELMQAEIKNNSIEEINELIIYDEQIDEMLKILKIVVKFTQDINIQLQDDFAITNEINKFLEEILTEKQSCERK